MKGRCSNPNNRSYIHYGGKGIKVCEDWQKFEGFMHWAMNNGYDDSLTIERIDINKGYFPENCKWIPPAAQYRNRSDSLFVCYDGEIMILKDFAKKYGLYYNDLRYKFHKGYSAEQMFFKPHHKRTSEELRVVGENQRQAEYIM